MNKFIILANVTLFVLSGCSSMPEEENTRKETIDSSFENATENATENEFGTEESDFHEIDHHKVNTKVQHITIKGHCHKSVTNTEIISVPCDSISEAETASIHTDRVITSIGLDDLEYVCKHRDATRIIRVLYDPEEGLVCKLTYEKSTGISTLWTAQNDYDYCADRATEFVQKQIGWGWTCFDDKDQEIIAQ